MKIRDIYFYLSYGPKGMCDSQFLCRGDALMDGRVCTLSGESET
jgi:hypothetical protein